MEIMLIKRQNAKTKKDKSNMVLSHFGCNKTAFRLTLEDGETLPSSLETYYRDHDTLVMISSLVLCLLIITKGNPISGR